MFFHNWGNRHKESSYHLVYHCLLARLGEKLHPAVESLYSTAILSGYWLLPVRISCFLYRCNAGEPWSQSFNQEFLFTLSIPGIVKPNGAEMFGFILCIVRISLLPLSSSKKELLARILLLQKENTVLKRSLEAKRKRPRFNFVDRMFYSILNIITDKTRYHFTLVKLRNSAEMDQEVYQRVLAHSTEKEENRKAWNV